MQRRTTRIALLVLIVLMVSTAHYVTPTDRPGFHAFYRWFYHLPIILGAFWFGLRGGVGLALLVTVLYLPHLFLHWSGGYSVQWLEVTLYNIVGWVTGSLSQGQMSERDRYRSAAEELDRAYGDLKTKARDLLETEEQLRHADRLSALGELSAGLAHEVKTPLASIRGTAEILAGETTREEREEFTEILQKEVDRLNQVVLDFLDFSRPEMDRECRADLREAASEILRLVAREAEKHGVALENRVEPAAPLVAVDPEQLRQVLLNLIVNAIQAQPDGGRITVSAHRNGEEVLLMVADEGPGIVVEPAEEVFEPFFTTRARGTGLGLSIVRKILRSHGASIEVDGRSGAGTTFTILLPLAE